MRRVAQFSYSCIAYALSKHVPVCAQLSIIRMPEQLGARAHYRYMDMVLNCDGSHTPVNQGRLIRRCPGGCRKRRRSLKYAKRYSPSYGLSNDSPVYKYRATAPHRHDAVGRHPGTLKTKVTRRPPRRSRGSKLTSRTAAIPWGVRYANICVASSADVAHTSPWMISVAASQSPSSGHSGRYFFLIFF